MKQINKKVKINNLRSCLLVGKQKIKLLKNNKKVIK